MGCAPSDSNTDSSTTTAPSSQTRRRLTWSGAIVPTTGASTSNSRQAMPMGTGTVLQGGPPVAPSSHAPTEQPPGSQTSYFGAQPQALSGFAPAAPRGHPGPGLHRLAQRRASDAIVRSRPTSPPSFNFDGEEETPITGEKQPTSFCSGGGVTAEVLTQNGSATRHVPSITSTASDASNAAAYWHHVVSEVGAQSDEQAFEYSRADSSFESAISFLPDEQFPVGMTPSPGPGTASPSPHAMMASKRRNS